MKNNLGVQALVWEENKLLLIDQRKLPNTSVFVCCHSAADIVSAIKDMVVRGAPAIGICAAYGAVLAMRECTALKTGETQPLLLSKLDAIADSRPTAVNLMWAIDQARTLTASTPWDKLDAALLDLALEIHRQDIEANLSMGDHALEQFRASGDGSFSVITHCNTGSLATGGYGTALGAIKSAWQAGILDHVYADETRPWLQGSRLTAWELQQDGIPFSLNADSAAAWIMQNRDVRWVIVGADRIASNGDVANKIGTYSLAVLARFHQVKVMVVAPTSTIDMSLHDGRSISIEMRADTELTHIAGQKMAPEGVAAINPVFDVTPAELVDVIVTEKGAVLAPDKDGIAALFT